MNTCDTCKHWDKQPDHLFDNAVEGKGADVFGSCRHGKLSCGRDHPEHDGLSSDYGYHIGGDTEIYTGPDFGCLHHVAKDSTLQQPA